MVENLDIVSVLSNVKTQCYAVLVGNFSLLKASNCKSTSIYYFVFVFIQANFIILSHGCTIGMTTLFNKIYLTIGYRIDIF